MSSLTARPAKVRSDDELIAYLLIRTWALATGRSLPRDVPIHQLDAAELIDFWADPLTEHGAFPRSITEEGAA